MRTVTLRDEKDGRDSRYLCAYLDDHGNLTIEGQDLGPSTGLVSGDGEYEWMQLICAEYIPHVLRILGEPAGVGILDALEARWSGEKAGELERRLRESNIPIKRSSWGG